MLDRMKVTGFRELEHWLKKFPDKLAAKAGRKAALAGANVVKNAAKKNVRESSGGGFWGSAYAQQKFGKWRTGSSRAGSKIFVPESPGGQLKREIRAKFKPRQGAGRFTYEVGATAKGFYGLFLELGTKPHVINARWAKALGPGGVFGAKVQHPGAQPHPWLRPAYDDNRDKAIEAMRKTLETEIPKIARSL